MAGQEVEFALRIEPDGSGQWKSIGTARPWSDVSASRDGAKCTIASNNKVQGTDEVADDRSAACSRAVRERSARH
jgi:hypothetical protein